MMNLKVKNLLTTKTTVNCLNHLNKEQNCNITQISYFIKKITLKKFDKLWKK